ncbi:hypothetical protein [Chitinophaga tropicalis]|uniref:Uncharacterized protein n=1 Tax=Chitinophaga tropicalis TaxID=2683588 RepID=A0A7K1UAS3_9BACT|nr:hypothetical protein [Chitinophaga tropicalis]MVT11360.1 hypothetical protein [Chitinophaga tropicalis]
MANLITSSVKQKNNQTIDLDLAFVKNVYEGNTQSGFYGEIFFRFQKGGTATWTYTADQAKEFEKDMVTLGLYK